MVHLDVGTGGDFKDSKLSCFIVPVIAGIAGDSVRQDASVQSQPKTEEWPISPINVHNIGREKKIIRNLCLLFHKAIQNDSLFYDMLLNTLFPNIRIG